MIIALLNDTHWGSRSDAPYMIDYQEKFFKTIFFPYMKEHNINRIFHLGDMFDRRKYVNFETLSRSRKIFFDVLRENNIYMDIIPGNHDVAKKNNNEINSIEQLLSEYNNINQIHEPTVLEYDNVKFMFLPWLNSENYNSSMEFVNNTEAAVLCSHLELKDFEMHCGIKNEHGLDMELFKKFDLVLSGHFHHKSSKGNIRYLGAQYQFVWSDYGDTRGFHTYNTETKELHFHENPHMLYEKIFYDDVSENSQEKYKTMDLSQYTNKVVKVLVTNKTKPAVFEYFVDNLYKENLIDLTIMEDYTSFSISDNDFEIKENSTKDLIEKYIDTAETVMDKNRLKSIINELYIEALYEGTK